MSYSSIWIGLIEETVRKVYKGDKIIIRAECKGLYYQAKMTIPGLKEVFGEPALNEDNAFRSLLNEIRIITRHVVLEPR